MIDDDVKKARDAEIDKAAATEMMPPPKEKCDDCEETRAERIARRGQDPPEPEPGMREPGSGD